MKVSVAGKRRADSRKDFKPETLEPVFGQMFELLVDLPMEKDLQIAVFDYDAIGTDELIGKKVDILPSMN